MASAAVIREPEASAVQEANEASPNFLVGTRKSKLAMAQTTLVVEALTKSNPNHTFTVKARDTAAGDIDKVTPFKDMAVKNIWTHELETLMAEGSLDILVHSLKGKVAAKADHLSVLTGTDVPTQLPDGCEIGGVLTRADPRDALVVKGGRPHCKISDLPAGSVIGTSSIRRTAQVALRYPHLTVKDLRGNVGTRLAKLDAEDSPYDAIILAAAGLHRLDLGDRISQYLDHQSSRMLYAVGQGAIGIENRSNDANVKKLLDSINHKPTYLATAAERSLLRFLEGGCSAPLGVETEWNQADGKSSLLLRSIVVSVDGKECVEIEAEQIVEDVSQAEKFGVYAANELLRKGAGKILEEIQAKKRTTVADLAEN